MHFICRADTNVVEKTDGTFETGVWKVAQKHADTVETVALHESKSDPSYRHGRVLGWHTVRHSGQDRFVFTVRPEGPPMVWAGGGSGEKGYRRG